jgi:hypothetical protein
MLLVHVPQSTMGFFLTPFLDLFFPLTVGMAMIFMFDWGVALDRATYREHWFGQVHTNIRNSLTLCFVNRHCKAKPYKKLLFELERGHLFIRGHW